VPIYDVYSMASGQKVTKSTSLWHFSRVI
jgi:hypothetical protein